MRKNTFGHFYYCKDCKGYHLVFNNLYFVLDKKNMSLLRMYIENLDLESLKRRCRIEGLSERYIPIPTLQNNLIIILNLVELNGFRDLIGIKPIEETNINVDDINYRLILN